MRTKLSKRSCHKVGYSSKAVARKAFNEFGRSRGCKRYYRCPHHKYELWHLTSEN